MGNIQDNITIKLLKVPKTYEEQLEILKQRNLIIEDDKFALDILSRINYYRFSAYLLPFKLKETEEFKPGTKFNDIYRIYEFDMKLRNLIPSVIEPIEILVRAKLAYFHAHKYGAEGYINSDNFDIKERHDNFIAELKDTIQKNRKTLFIKHHLENYGERLPIWVAVEIFSFGMLSKFYSNLKGEDRKDIAKSFFNTGSEYLASWLACITDLRNRCAHYMRLYFHKQIVLPKLSKDSEVTLSNRIFDVINVMKFLYTDKDSWNNSFVQQLEALIEQYSDVINEKHIGFPNNWSKILKKY